MENVLHTREEILNKEFKKTRIGVGYDMTDVDAFLDEIMADYQAFQNNVAELEQQNQRLNDQITDLKQQVAAASSAPAKQAPTANVNANMDILKRLSNLERRVFGTPSDTFTTSSSENTSQEL